MTVVFPDAMNDLRYWLRRQSDVAAFTNGRCFFRIPDNALFPLQRIYRSGGSVRQTGGGAPLQDLLVSIECWTNELGGYGTLRELVAATESAVFGLTSNTRINPTGNTLVVDAVVSNVIDSPDPDTGWPRFICDSRFSVISAPL